MRSTPCQPSLNSEIAVIGIDIGKNSFRIVGLHRRGAIVLRQKWSRGQIETRLANLPPCLIDMETCVANLGAAQVHFDIPAIGSAASL
jgi:transposase